MSPVWEHPNGARLHAGGYLRLNDRTAINWWDRRYYPLMRIARIMQPSRRKIRALMVWAELIMENFAAGDGTDAQAGSSAPSVPGGNPPPSEKSPSVGANEKPMP